MISDFILVAIATRVEGEGTDLRVHRARAQSSGGSVLLSGIRTKLVPFKIFFCLRVSLIRGLQLSAEPSLGAAAGAAGQSSAAGLKVKGAVVP